MARKKNDGENPHYVGPVEGGTEEPMGGTVIGNGEEANPAATDSNGEGGTEAAKRSGPRNRSDSEYWLVATDPMDGTSEFLLSEPTVGQGRKARVKMLRSPMARGRKIRLARVTYVEG